MKPQRTRSQERILKLLKNASQPLSAQAIYLELRNREESMGLATVYRSLDVLKTEGAIQVRNLVNGEAVYSSLQEDRHHLTCLHCGLSLPIAECPVHTLETELKQVYHFQVFYHTLEFFGLCTNCQSASSDAS